MTRNESLIQAIEYDLVKFHRQRMSERAGLQMQLLRTEESRPVPNMGRINLIREAMVETTRNKLNTAVTINEVIEPLRRGVSINTIKQADLVMADPKTWKKLAVVVPEKKTRPALAAR